MACSSNREPGPSNGPLGGGLACSLEGTWSRCQSSGGQSQRVTLNVIGTALSETIEQFNSVDDCSGVDYGQFSFNATLQLDEDGASTFVSGATDATLTPDVDLFGCGVSQPAYTFMKFDSSCDSFQGANAMPSCDPASRGTALDPEPFIKQ